MASWCWPDRAAVGQMGSQPWTHGCRAPAETFIKPRREGGRRSAAGLGGSARPPTPGSWRSRDRGPASRPARRVFLQLVPGWGPASPLQLHSVTCKDAILEITNFICAVLWHSRQPPRVTFRSLPTTRVLQMKKPRLDVTDLAKATSFLRERTSKPTRE